jgi:biopolymer transport protein ExbB
MEQSRLFSNAKKIRHQFWAKESLEEALVSIDQESAFCYIAQNAIAAKKEHHTALASQVSLNTWIEMSFNRSIEEIQSKLSVGLAFLATVGSTAPFIGLFGTVWGIVNSFQSIGASKNTSLAVVAPGIAEALIATAMGLFAAIPAVIFYNVFSNKIRNVSAKLEDFHGELITILEPTILDK